MKRHFTNRAIKLGLCALPAAALMLGAAQGGQIGINFQVDFTPYASYSGKPVTASAFGIDPTNWFSMTPAPYAAASTGNQIVPIPEGGALKVTWSVKNGWSSGIDSTSGTNVPPGFDEVIWGYLDDSSPGWTVTISGFRSMAGNFTLQTISASDSTSGFGNINLSTNGVFVEALNYTNDPSQFIQVGGAGWGTSTVSMVYVTANGNDSITLTGASGHVGTIRNTLAGILVGYSPPSVNPPKIELAPQTPTNTLFPGGSFTLTASASGAPTLGYQWYKGANPISGATGTAYTKTNIVVGDSGSYMIVASNSFGTANASASVVVQNVQQPQILQPPVSQTFYKGYPATFAVSATGGQLSYIWKHGATVLSSGSSSTLSLASISTNDAGTYSVIVSNGVGTATASATLTVILPTSPYSAAVAQQLPLEYYRLSETGTLNYDTAANSGSLGTAGTGSYLGGFSHPVAGALVGSSDTAASFDGASGQVTVPYSATLNPATFTAEAWLKPAITTSGTLCAISCGDFGATRAGWLVYQTGTGWNFRTYNQNGASTAVNVVGGAAPVAGTWYHVAVTWDGNVGTVYVNGVGTASTPTNYVPGTAGPFAVGSRADNAFFWNGAADEVAYYPTVLTPAQILAHYQNGTNAAPGTPYNTLITSAGPVEYLRLDEPAFPGNTQNLGTSGFAENGTLSATGVLDGQSGPQPPALGGFESTNLCVQFTAGSMAAPALPLVTNSVTYVAWVNLNGDNTANFPGIMFSRPLATGISLDNGDNLSYTWNDDAGTYGFASGLALTPGQWTLVAAVITPTNATLYTGTTNGLVSAVNTHNHAVHDFSTAPLLLGNDTANNTRHLNASLDEAAFYSYALTYDQIATLLFLGVGQPLHLTMSSGGVIVDTKPVGTPHNGFDHGAVWLASSGPDVNSITRTGVEQFIATNATQITTPADPDFNSTVGTICFWMNYSVPLSGFPGHGAEAAMLFDHRTTNGAIIGANVNGGIEFQTVPGTANSFTAGYVTDGNWHHVAITYDQSVSGTVTLYIDGVQTVANPNTTNWAWPATQEIELGRSHDPYWYRYDGQLDDVRVYNRILTAGEVSTIATFATSDSLIDTTALRLRYNFDNIGIGKTLTWPLGTLLSSPAINGPNAVWTPVNGATSPYPFLPAGPSQFFRVKL